MKYYLVTFGCQMNQADSERIASGFEAKNYKKAKKVEDADLVVINTCSVRQSAEDRVLGLVENLKKLKNQGKQKIILTGCMLRYNLYQLKKILPSVDEFIKTQDLISNAQPLRKNRKHAWVTIMEGCDNFCTYCVVPYARGREASRPIEEIYCEVKELAKRGCETITLLGQNVNSFGKNSNLKAQISNLHLKSQNLKKIKNPFALLLRLLHAIPSLKKIKFITSNPQDLTDEIIKAMKLPKIDRYLHLPVQSGDDQILKRMNRKYTAKKYLDLIKKIRKAIPEIEIGTDIIVGFPGETEKAFQNTLDLCKKAKFNVAYIAKYSPRLGTTAFKFKDDIPYKEKKRRWQILDKLINRS